LGGRTGIVVVGVDS
jgi:hypothetical protein